MQLDYLFQILKLQLEINFGIFSLTEKWDKIKEIVKS